MTEYLSHQHIAYQVFADVEAGISALQKRRIDALVYDRPLLIWQVSEHHSESLQVLDATFDPQVYAIALPQGSELRLPIDLALLADRCPLQLPPVRAGRGDDRRLLRCRLPVIVGRRRSSDEAGAASALRARLVTTAGSVSGAACFFRGGRL
jgi:hypothetical protein